MGDQGGCEEREGRKEGEMALVSMDSSSERKGQGSLWEGGWAPYLRKRIGCAGGLFGECLGHMKSMCVTEFTTHRADNLAV